MRRIFLVLLLGCFPILSCPAAETGEASQLRSLVDELNRQLDRAERNRLADPWFLRDLRELVRRYDYPWRQSILHDDFSAGERPAPPWQVMAGEFLADWRYGMRSVIRPPARQGLGGGGGKEGADEKDIAAALLGALLEQALEGKSKGKGGGAREVSIDDHARLIAKVAIPNAFAITLRLNSRPLPGVDAHLVFGPYRAVANSPGYRLVWRSGATARGRSLELLRISPRGGVATLELYDRPLKLDDGADHLIIWTRDRFGQMEVKVDGNILFSVLDRSFRDPFDGFTLSNLAGDIALREVRIDGAP